MNEQLPSIELTSSMVTCLCDLYSESGGRIGIAYPIKAHWNTIEALFNRGLIMRDAQIENGKVIRYIALTPTGAHYSCEHLETVINDKGINTDRPRKCVSLFFEYDENKYPDHVKAYKRVGELKKQGDFRPTMIDLLNMDKELESGQVGMLMELYPEAVQTLRDMLRLEVEAEQKRQETHVLKEMIRQTVTDAMQNPPQPSAMPRVSDLQPVSGSTQGIRQIGANNAIPLPSFDDDEDDLELTVTASTIDPKEIAQNFIRSIGALNG